MTGPEMLIKSLAGLIGVDPAEIHAAWERSKDALPQLAREFQTLNDRMARMEQSLERIERAFQLTASQQIIREDSGIGDLKVLSPAEFAFSDAIAREVNKTNGVIHDA